MSVSLRCHFDVTSIPLRLQYDLTSVSLPCHFDFTLVLLRINFDFTSVSLRFYFDRTSNPLRLHFHPPLVLFRFHFDLTSVSLRCHLPSSNSHRNHSRKQPNTLSCERKKGKRSERILEKRGKERAFLAFGPRFHFTTRPGARTNESNETISWLDAPSQPQPPIHECQWMPTDMQGYSWILMSIDIHGYP